MMTRDDVLAWMEQNGITPMTECPKTFDGYVDMFEAVARRAFAAGAADNQAASGFLGEQLQAHVDNAYKAGFAGAREAAAPDLLAALNQIADYARKDGDIIAQHLGGIARAAIIKATRQQ